MRAAVETVVGLLRSEHADARLLRRRMSRSPCVAGAAVALVRGCPIDEGLKIAVKSGPADVSPGLWSEVRAIVSAHA